MEAATEERVQPVVEESPAEDRGDEKIDREWRTYVHVGEGAQECEHKEDGRCKESEHFHAFCRLPNSLQINAIREKANAAKARALRALRDPETDRGVTMETDLETLRQMASPEELVSEIMAATRWRDRGQVMVSLTEEEERFEHIDDDQERARVLNAMPDDERPQEEHEQLLKHIEDWNNTVDAKLIEVQQPERDSLEAKDEDEIIELIRDQRIKAEINEIWMQVYTIWEWYIGTLKPRPPEKGLPVDRMWSSIEQMKADTPERIEAIETVFEALENGTLSPSSKVAVRAEGNS